jgi:hypothetical protein
MIAFAGVKQVVVIGVKECQHTMLKTILLVGIVFLIKVLLLYGLILQRRFMFYSS